MNTMPISPDDIPPQITALADTAPYWINPRSTPALLAHYWPAIEQHIREQVAQEIERRICTWKGMGDMAEATNEAFRQSARIARGTNEPATEETPR
ncbi:hypothetical protein TR51_06475 [Kitasatospora griseola]|uniref:Uncharacterized protein n=1 Tax=Kitasatospora griseola TaxID=2064 RepID=A0A0D0NFF0_KITGR|nr:hypothetical protein [Kitasatospora griseola]KIQ67030.1 hypothetical protein TR51_06475 [Kitasatospora griseola]